MENNEQHVVSENVRLYGRESVVLEVHPYDVTRFEKLYELRMAGIPKKLRQSLDSFVADQVALAAKNAEKYAIAQANAKLEKLVFEAARRTGKTIADVEAALGVKLADRK